MNYKIPIYKPTLNGNEKKYVLDCLDSTWISSKGKYVNEFEKAFANYIGINHATTVNNGTIALHLALLALGIEKGSEVIVPTFTYIASVNAISYIGAIPVFVDSLKETWQMDPADVRKKITNKTKAIMAVHLYGYPCEMNELVKIAKENDLFLIEDCAEAIGSKYEEKYVGTFGDIAAFSFFGNKTITTGEGGMVVTNDETLFDRSVHFKGQGLAKNREYWHDVIGYNYRMTNICAAIGVAQLERIDEIINKKRKIAGWYQENIKGLPISFHNEIGNNIFHSYWMNNILVDKSETRENLRIHLAENGIETRPTFYPVHTMPMYSQKFQKHPIAEYLGWRGITLPSYSDLTETDIKFICERIKEVLLK